MITSIRDFMRGKDNNNQPEAPHVKVYEYDQLNRLAYAHTYDMTTTVSSSNIWNSLNQVDKYKTNYTYDANGNIINLDRFDKTGQQIDEFNYNYPANRNRLTHVDDPIANTVNTEDIDDQSSTNYAYDKIGNLIKDEQEEIENIEWNVSGKIKSIKRYDNSNKADLEFRYDAMGHRVVKIVKPRPLGNPSNEDDWIYTYYVRDANGNIMATYNKKTIEANNTYTVQYDLEEHTLYGSSRIGISRKPDTEAPQAELTFANNVTYNSNGSYNLSSVSPSLTLHSGNPNIKQHYLGLKQYELTNHLGNVLATVSDIKTPVLNGTDIVSYEADVNSATIYDPFGVEQRRGPSSGGYRFSYNGGEAINEVYGDDNYVDLGERGVDTRLGRLNWTIDPRASEYPWQSPYAYYGNSTIVQLDYNGEGDYYGKDGKHLGSDKNKSDNKVYTGSMENRTADLDEDGKETGTYTFKDPTLLSITHTNFQKQAATVYGESSVAYGIESKEEMFAIASVHQKNKIAFAANSDKAAEFSNTPINKQTSAMQLSNAAMVNALTGGFDYSYGADQWDGAEQSMVSKANMDKASNGRFMYKMNVMGWNISDGNYKSWKSSVENKFGAGKFTVPQNKAAMHNYGGMTNKGKTRLNSTAQYGLTIFWKTN